MCAAELNQLTGIAALLTFPLDIEAEDEIAEAELEESRAAKSKEEAEQVDA